MRGNRDWINMSFGSVHSSNIIILESGMLHESFVSMNMKLAFEKLFLVRTRYFSALLAK
jgi:hypothetical protein